MGTEFPNMRKTQFEIGEHYHIYNRGVDKRSIFEDKEDLLRFLQSMEEFNVVEPNGGIYSNSFHKNKELGNRVPKLVRFVGYCLNQNHYHFILSPIAEKGVQKFMHKLSLGYTNYFNEKYTRSGSLFQGKYKAIHIETNEYLLHLSVYVNLNDKVHKDLNREWLSKLPFSSFPEYKGGRKYGICNTTIVLGQYKSYIEYCRYADTVLFEIIQRKEREKSLKQLFIE